MEKAIIVEELSKKYKLYNNTKERLLDIITPKNYGEDFYALSNVSFEAEIGEVVGFVGINGSGKSTLSNIIAGIVPETSGSVKVNGEVSLIAVAAGLNNELTGRDNIELKLLMLGFNRDEIKALEQDIIEFSELESFIDQPVKSYSSGMRSRLGFAISVNIDPDILIIDEALSVGDKAFAEKSLKKIKEFKEDGKTMIFVSHSINQMRRFCDKILWLEFGMVKEYGDVNEVLSNYERFLEQWKLLSKEERKEYRINALNNNHDKNEELLKSYEETKYKERELSRLGKFRPHDSVIYASPKSDQETRSSQKYKGNVYFVKKVATYNHEEFYLISNLPSSSEGLIGWVKKQDLSTRSHVFIDVDEKKFSLKGVGQAFNMPWGDKNNVVIPDLADYKDEMFQVKRTDRVGRTIWYYGKLRDKSVWIRKKYTSEVKTELHDA